MNSQSPPAAADLRRALELHHAGGLAEAEALYRRVLAQAPKHGEALHYLGLLKAQMGDFESALELAGAAVKADPQSAQAHLGLGHLRAAVGQPEAALQSYDQALALKPDYPEALYSRGNALQGLKRHEEAVASYDRLLALSPDVPEVLTNRGNALHDLKRYEEAVASYDRALARLPGVAMLHNNRGNTLREMKRFAEALASLDRALALEPGYVEALINRGNVLQDLGRFEEALACFDKALAIEPDHLPALNNRGNVLRDLQRHEEAAKTVARLLELAPDWDYAIGLVFQSQRYSCDWSQYQRNAERLVKAVRDGKKADIPFAFLSVSQSAADQLRCARTYTADKYPASPAPLWTGQKYRHDRIRVAYLSGDFHNHATAYLMAGLFEKHDRRQFEISAISFGPDAADEMRNRLRVAFDQFIDVRDKNDREAALLLREMEVDIAVDLKGFTMDSRVGILAHRPAPIQVNYLGYPGTMGADYMDYIIADRHVIPPGHQAFYTEKIVYLPDSYQVNDSRRRISEHTSSRAESGLPESGFVFCCFNNNYKITPQIFDVWMRLLRRCERSVLWLLDDNAAAVNNLRREAESRGVAPQRLVFAPRVPLAEHLARHRLADLFLDTLPYNAHTTASDALWAGLPVLTCLGDAFAGRVAASLLNAVGLPELVVNSLEQYENLALKLATDGNLLTKIKSGLSRGRMAHPLFDTDRFRRHLEAAYVAMWQRSQRGETPESFAVTAAQQI
jgi:predicted O-linked N-acetylglucosamine transferase (SPINDLY family)